ncbi:Dihydroorotase [Gonapodya prolifera JEL478]|uniref:dihydroorotase n=1 Tax=Gonapodya prolifera (strain JEL478) TaxID=1344416 RepID=A0A139A1W9_GONPJ|nr:Dihydroorotase [Gonapodya prolifera JEL478]|eukprot:KXS10734.1 Dihydroorotase [Gonapodya prolifera JEL478]
MSSITTPLLDDFHIHLRQGSLMGLVTPMVRSSGVGLALVMPNLRPPITTTAQAISYKKDLEKLAPGVQFLMTLYLTPELTVDEVKKAKEAGVVGVKSYPRGVTTNSDSGIESYETYYPVFKAMEECGLALNLHGEIPSDHARGVTILNAEERFLHHLVKLHDDFPRLRIVLEHATTEAAVECVKSLGPTVGCSITVHHLDLVVDDWAGQNHHFCKPVAKLPSDRDALRQVVKEGHPRFFMGTDSAPHPRHTKETAHAHAGVFVTPHTAEYLASVLDSFGALNQLSRFACENGRAFYGLTLERDVSATLTMKKHPRAVEEEFEFVDDDGVRRAVVPFWAGHTLAWQISE